MSKSFKCWAFLSTFVIAIAWIGCTGVDSPAGEQEASSSIDEQDTSAMQTNPTEANEDASAEAELYGCRCFGTWFNTQSAACSTSSCSESESCLYGLLSDYVDCSDELCSQHLVITKSCFSPGPGSWQVNGYLRYKCGFTECY